MIIIIMNRIITFSCHQCDRQCDRSQITSFHMFIFWSMTIFSNSLFFFLHPLKFADYFSDPLKTYPKFLFFYSITYVVRGLKKTSECSGFENFSNLVIKKCSLECGCYRIRGIRKSFFKGSENILNFQGCKIFHATLDRNYLPQNQKRNERKCKNKKC